MDNTSRKYDILKEELSQEIQDIRHDLACYVTAILGSLNGVDDVIQEVALVVLEKEHQRHEIKDFKAWCFKIAYFKALSYRRDQKRLGEQTLDVELLERVAARAFETMPQMSQRRTALEQCYKRLSQDEQELLNFKYIEGGSLTKLAKICGIKSNKLHKKISRVRHKLRKCVERSLS